MTYFFAGLSLGLAICVLLNKWWAELYDEMCEEWFEICQALLDHNKDVFVIKGKEDKR